MAKLKEFGAPPPDGSTPSINCVISWLEVLIDNEEELPQNKAREKRLARAD